MYCNLLLLYLSPNNQRKNVIYQLRKWLKIKLCAQVPIAASSCSAAAHIARRTL